MFLSVYTGERGDKERQEFSLTLFKEYSTVHTYLFILFVKGFVG